MAEQLTGGAHRAAEVPRRSGSRRFVYGVLALLVAGLLVMGGQGTFAYWNDSATVSATNVKAGTLDLTVANAQQGSPTAYAESKLAVAAMLPGESVAATIAINNVGDADFTWSPSLSGMSGMASSLTIKFFVGGSTAGQRATYPRNETCTGAVVASGATAARLNRAAASQTLCVQYSLPQAAGNELQGAAGSFQVAISAVQALTAAP